MKSFISKTLIFIGISISLLCIIFFTTNSLVNSKANFSLKKPVKNVVFGHSHSECAFNDSIIDDFKNLSQSRQSYFYSYQKIKKVITQNKEIKNVFIEFTNNQLDKPMNNWIWDDLAITSKSMYLPFLQKEDIKLLIRKNSDSFVTGSSKSFRNNLMNILLYNYNYTNKMGGYVALKRNKIDSLISYFKTNTHQINDFTHDLSIKNIEYLEKIVSFCNEQNLTLYFVRSPQHKYNPYRGSEKEFRKIKNEKFKDIPFLDFNNFPLEDNAFGDFGHLNYHGAKVFSSWFNQLLKKGLLLKRNKEEFIKNEMNKLKLH